MSYLIIKNIDVQISLAKEFARVYHCGQYRRDGKTPDFDHLQAVVQRLETQNAHAMVIATGWLQDIFENPIMTAESLNEYFLPEIVRAVSTLRKTPGLDHDNYLGFVKLNPIAREVKIADILSNLSGNLTESEILKYAKDLSFLLK